MTLPSISVLMPVCAWPEPSNLERGTAHPELIRALDSVVEGLATSDPNDQVPKVELLVGVDGRAERVIDAVVEWALNATITVRLEAFEKSSEVTFGNRQRNRFLDMGAPQGDLIVWQDQDDRFFRGALTRASKIAAQHPGLPLIFRMQAMHWDPPDFLWKKRGWVERNHIGGHMLVSPNEPAMLGRWLPETSYAADFDFIKATLDNFSASGREAFWSEEFISMLRPHVMGI